MKNINKSKWVKVSKKEFYPKNLNITQLNKFDLNLLKVLQKKIILDQEFVYTLVLKIKSNK